MECVDRGASLVCLPEYFAYMMHPAIPHGFNEPLNGPVIDSYRKIALDNQCWLSLGGFQESFGSKSGEEIQDYPSNAPSNNEIKAEMGYKKTHNPGSVKRYNTHLIINSEGQIVSKYRKMHLFDVDMTSKGGVMMNEGQSIERGLKIEDPIYSPCGYLGLSISFDVRFPEMYRELVLKGAQTLLVPSHFLP